MVGRLLAVGCGAIVLGGAAPAQALTAHVDGVQLIVSAAPGETNAVDIQPDPLGPTGASFVIVDSGEATTHAGPGCTKTLRALRCSMFFQSPGVALLLSLGDRADTATVAGNQYYLEEILAGSGNDRVDITRATGDGWIEAGPGNDVIDTLNGISGDGIDCGTGKDRLITDPSDRRFNC